MGILGAPLLCAGDAPPSLNLVENPDRVEEMGECARKFASQFTWERALGEFDAGLEAVLA